MWGKELERLSSDLQTQWARPWIAFGWAQKWGDWGAEGRLLSTGEWAYLARGMVEKGWGVSGGGKWNCQSGMNEWWSFSFVTGNN